MEYFKKLSVKTVPQTIIDCPVRIQEIAILQDSFDKNILGRIKFVNQSKENIIAVFLDLSAKDISGEPVTLNNDSFIYQDICAEPGELYGNKIAIDLPDAVRMLSAEINRVVFEDGTVWKASDAKTCYPFVLEQIEQPHENFDRIRDELIKTIPNIDYVNYYFQKNESAWLCSCGKINPSANKVCSFCGCEKNALEAVLTKENFSSFCDNIDKIVEEEEAEAAKIAAEKEQQRIKEEARKAEEERKRREEENKRREEEANKERVLREEEERRVAKRRKNIIAVVAPLMIIVITTVIAISVYNYRRGIEKNYSTALEKMEEKDYLEAIDLFTDINGYKDSDDQVVIAQNAIKEEQYFEACNLFNAGDYDEAYDIFSSLEGYMDSEDQAEKAAKERDYMEACKLFYAGDYEKSRNLFSQLKGYKDSDEFREKTQDDIATGTHISFDMDSSECEDVLKLYIPADSIKTFNQSNNSSILNLRAEITSTQAAQLTGMHGLQDLTDIEEIQVSFNRADKMLNILFALKEIENPSDFYLIENGESNFKNYIEEIIYTITHSKDINVEYDFHMNEEKTEYDKSEADFEFFGYTIKIMMYNQNHQGEQQIILRKASENTTSSGSSSKSSSSGSSSSTHTCQASGCNKAGTHAITGLNGTTEYYCSEHYSQMSGMMNMIMGN